MMFPASWHRLGQVFYFLSKSKCITKYQPYFIILTSFNNSFITSFVVFEWISTSINFYRKLTNNFHIRPFTLISTQTVTESFSYSAHHFFLAMLGLMHRIDPCSHMISKTEFCMIETFKCLFVFSLIVNLFYR